eukprot:2803518-Amphidinium_carterae.1
MMPMRQTSRNSQQRLEEPSRSKGMHPKSGGAIDTRRMAIVTSYKAWTRHYEAYTSENEEQN